MPLLRKYFTFIILLTISVMSSIITSDVVLTRTFFATEEGYCAMKVDEDNTTSKILTALALLVFVAQLIMFGIGMILYLMVSRSFCELKRADVKVCLALVSTAGILFVVSFLLINDCSTSIPLLLRSIGTVAEQLLLSIALCKKSNHFK